MTHEAGAYARFQEKYPDVGYLGLNVADETPRARAFVRRYGWTWPSIVDPERERAKRLSADYQPFVALVDAQGRIVAVHDGGGDEDAWAALLARLG